MSYPPSRFWRAALHRARCVLLILSAGLWLSSADAAFTVQERTLLRDGQPFQVRGVCYQPAPIGDNPSAALPYGDYFTTNYGAITARDLPRVRELGANTLRIYGWSATADHQAFLDACYNGGTESIYVIVNRWINPVTNWNDAAAVTVIEQEFLQTDQRLGTHPGVLAIVLGNEANIQNNNGNNAAFWAAMNRIALAIKSQTPTRLVSVAITDSIPQIAAHDAQVPALDFWCVQTYRGTTLGSLFTEYAAASAKPLLITEFGLDAYNHATGAAYPNNAAFVGTTVAGLWREIAANAAVCVGGCVFEYADEWWKSATGLATTHDGGGFPLGGLPDGFANEEWWGLYAVARNAGGLDTLTPRATVAELRAAWAVAVPQVGRLRNLSVRSRTGTGEAVLIAGFVVAGGSAELLVRGIGPGLTPLKVEDVAPNPELQIFSGQTPGDFNQDWDATDATLVAAMQNVWAFPLAAGSGDAALLTTVSGLRSVHVRDTVPGVALAEIYEVGTGTGRLINISARAEVGTGEDVLVVGFVIDGDLPKRLLLRGVGPGLAGLKVEGLLEDPVLRLYNQAKEVLATNDDWVAADTAAVAQSVSAFALAEGSADATFVITLAPGVYTAHVTGAGDTTGIALVEVYEVE